VSFDFRRVLLHVCFDTTVFLCSPVTTLLSHCRSLGSCKHLSQGSRTHSGRAWNRTDVGARSAGLSFYSLQDCTLPAFLPTNASPNTSVSITRMIPSSTVSLFQTPAGFSIQKYTMSLVSTLPLLACFCVSASAEIE